jgi:protein-tyrosine phosphatase
MLDEGLCHLLATDAHNTEQRAPRMADARDVVAQRIGDDEAINLVLKRPQGILNNLNPAELPPLPQDKDWQQGSGAADAPTLWGNILRRARRMAGAE